MSREINSPRQTVGLNEIPMDDAQLMQRMEELRGRLEVDADAAKRHLNQMTDWRHLVRSAPLPSIGVAVLAGYLLVPKRTLRKHLDAKDVEKLTDHHPVIVQTEKAEQSLLNTLMAVTGAGVARFAASYLASQLEQFTDNHSNLEVD